ncbi:MAG: hydroxypyruvate isomerase, partial [Pseudomonadota bacterium]|nr:hydroxypyruvate isomerase [Pseudomonadota bacterium]
MKLTANLSLLYTELPMLERFAAAAEDGFTAVEIQFPYDTPADELRRALDDTG